MRKKKLKKIFLVNVFVTVLYKPQTPRVNENSTRHSQENKRKKELTAIYYSFCKT